MTEFCLKQGLKIVHVDRILEIRTGWSSDLIGYPSSPVTSKVFRDVSPELPLASSSQNDGGVQKTTSIYDATYVCSKTYLKMTVM